MIIVNPYVRILAVWPLVGVWEVDGDRSWIGQTHERFLAVDFRSAAAHGQIAELVRTDLVPWLKQWDTDLLESLRSCLEYELAHERTLLREFFEPTSLDLLQDVFESFWEPLWAGVFGAPRTERPLGDYVVLSVDAGREAIAGHEPDPPVWPWLLELEAQTSAERGVQQHYLYLFKEAKDRLVSQEERDARFGRVMLAEGRMALDASRAHVLEHPGTLWPLPDAGPIAPTDGPARLSSPLEVFCSVARADEWESEFVQAVGFETLEQRLVQAGSGLGLIASDSLEANIAAALDAEAGVGRVFEPWKTWATVAQALIDARGQDLFLSL